MNSPLSEAVINGDWDSAASLTKVAVESGQDPQAIIFGQLQPAMGEVGDRFSSGEYFLPDMLAAGRAMTAALETLKPLLGDKDVHKLGTVIVGTVAGDVHEIGKSMVAMFLRGTGFEVDDLGVDIAPEKFVEAVKEYRPDILGLSSLLTTTMPNLGNTIKAMEEAGLRGEVKIIVGGAPVTQRYADMIGADGYASDAGQAAELCKRLAGITK